MSNLEGATLIAESNGVRWLSKSEGQRSQNTVHFMVMASQTIEGPWVSGRFVFEQLATLTGDELAAFIRRLTA